MDWSYVLTPALAWLAAGSTKFAINTVRTGKLAFGHIGYGGMPSTHSAIVCATATLIALKEGLAHPAFGVAVTLAVIVMLDANSLRRQIGKQAQVLNQLTFKTSTQPLRERIGHSFAEIAAGILVGMGTAALVHCIFAL